MFKLFIFITLLISNLYSQNETSKIDTTIAIYNGDASALILVAKKYKLFENQGINVKIDKYPTGKKAMEKMLLGSADYSTATEFANIKNSLSNNSFKILASISEGNLASVIAFKSSGINSPNDFKNKKLGMTLGTASEFYSAVFLNQYNLSLDDVEISNIHPSKRYEVMQNKEVDALFSWEPYTYNLRKKYKEELAYFDIPVNFGFNFLLSVNKDFHNKNTSISKKILLALIEAEKLIIKKPEILKKVLIEEFNYDSDYLKYTLNKHFYTVSLPYSLYTLMNYEKNWLLHTNNSLKIKENLINLFDISILESVYKPRVTMYDIKGNK